MKRIFILTTILCTFIYTSCKHEKHTEEAKTKFLVSSPVLKDTLIYKEYVSQIHSVNQISGAWLPAENLCG